MKHDPAQGDRAQCCSVYWENCSFLVEVFDTGIHEALQNAPGGVITADFIRGTTEPSVPGTQLAIAVSLVPAALPEICARHGASVSAFREIKARYSKDIEGPRMIVSVTDAQGHRSETEYSGYSSKRVKSLDSLGRMRSKPVRKSST
jgi:hypothetical protein